MADEDDRMPRPGDHAFGLGDIFTKRDRRLLDDEHFIARIRENVVGVLPARAIDESAVDQDDGNGPLGGDRGDGRCDRHCSKRGNKRLHSRLRSLMWRHCRLMSLTSAPETLRYSRFLRDDGRILLIYK